MAIFLFYTYFVVVVVVEVVLIVFKMSILKFFGGDREKKSLLPPCVWKQTFSLNVFNAISLEVGQVGSWREIWQKPYRYWLGIDIIYDVYGFRPTYAVMQEVCKKKSVLKWSDNMRLWSKHSDMEMKFWRNVFI